MEKCDREQLSRELRARLDQLVFRVHEFASAMSRLFDHLDAPRPQVPRFWAQWDELEELVDKLNHCLSPSCKTMGRLTQELELDGLLKSVARRSNFRGVTGAGELDILRN